MKLRSLLIAALITSSATLAIGKEEPKKAGVAVIPVKGTEVFKLIYKSENTNKVKLKIYDSIGKVIYSETINEEGFIYPLNFSGLDAGEYSIELTDANGKKTEKVNYLPRV